MGADPADQGQNIRFYALFHGYLFPPRGGGRASPDDWSDPAIRGFDPRYLTQSQASYGCVLATIYILWSVGYNIRMQRRHLRLLV